MGVSKTLKWYAPKDRVFKIALKSCAFFTYSIDALDHQIWRKVFIRPSLMWRCLPSSNLCLKLKLTRLPLSAKLRWSGIIRIIGVTPASLSSDILPFTIPKIDSTGSELALCDSPSLTNASSRSTYSNMNEPTLHCRSFPDIRLVVTSCLHRQIVPCDQPLFLHPSLSLLYNPSFLPVRLQERRFME